MKLQIGHIGKTIVAGQRRFGRALQQVVQFVLFVVLLGQEAVLQWQPHQTVIVPLFCRSAPQLVEQLGDPLKGAHHHICSAGWYDPRRRHPTTESSSRAHRILAQRVVPLLAAQ